jgi:hypothetical protein
VTYSCMGGSDPVLSLHCMRGGGGEGVLLVTYSCMGGSDPVLSLRCMRGGGGEGGDY